MEILNRLQFVHCDTLFATCEEAKLYVESIHNLQRPTLYAEPMILKYGQEENPNILLAIGSVGNGSANMNNKTFFIDFNFVDSKVKELESLVNAEADDIANIKDILTTIKNGCGFTQDGEYITPENELLNKASSLANADVLLAEYIQALEAKTTLNVESTSSVELTLSKAEDGMLLSSDVVLAQNIIVDNKLIQPNIIVSTANGLFSSVQLDYQSASNALVFAVNGVDKTIALPEHINVVNGIYSTTTEEIILTMNNGDTVKIAMGELIREWTVKEDSNTPIVLKLEQVTAIDLAHGAKEWQDVLTADVRISDDIHAPFNILAKDQDGRSLRVDGLANKIQYNVADNQYISVQTAMDNINVDYNQATNVLTFNLPNNETKSIALNAVQLLDEIRYDADTEAIIIIYKDVYNQTQKISIPVSKLITEWTVGNNGHTVSLAKTRSVEGLDILTADVNVTEKGVENNIIEVLNNKLYVNGIAENIKYNEMTVKEGMDLLDSQIVANAQSVIAEKDRAEAAENKIEATVGLAEDGSFIKNAYNYGGEAKTIGAEISHLDAELKAANDRIVDNTNYTKQVEDNLKQVATDLAVESARAMAAEGAISGFVQSETIRALQAEDELREKIEAEEARAIEKENAINIKLDGEITRAQNEEVRLDKIITDEITRSTTQDETLLNIINTEITRATAKENAIEEKFDKEVSDLKQGLADEVLRAKKEEAKLWSGINEEVIRATTRENAIEANLTKAIADEKTRAEAAESGLTQAINELDLVVERELGPSGSVMTNINALKDELIGGATELTSFGKVEGSIEEVHKDIDALKIQALSNDEIQTLKDSANIREAYKLIDSENAQHGSVIKIYKDSSLKEVKLEKQKLKFTYILADGTEETVGVDVSEFLAESEFKDGLQVNENGEVSVKLAGDITESGQTYPNLITCNKENADENGALGLHNIKTNATILHTDITVAGLDEKFGAGNYKNGTTIAAGTDIYTILQNILCKELYPQEVPGNTITYSSLTYSLSTNTPQFKLTYNNGANEITGTTATDIEVGTLITLASGSVSGSTTPAKTKDSKVSNMLYGYSYDINKENTSTATTITAANIQISQDTTKNYKIAAALTGFTNSNKVTPTQASSNANGATLQSNVNIGYLSEGTNKVTVSATGATYTYSCDSIPSVYCLSNLGNVNSEYTTNEVPAVVNKSVTASASSISKTITAKYKYFIGCKNTLDASTLTSSDIRNLSGITDYNTGENISGNGWIETGSTATTTIIDANAAISDGNSIIIACPKTYKLVSIENEIGMSQLGEFQLLDKNINVQTGGIETPYSIYVMYISNGGTLAFKNVKLKK